MKILIKATSAIIAATASQFALAHPGHTTELFHSHEMAPVAYLALGIITTAALAFAIKRKKETKDNL